MYGTIIFIEGKIKGKQKIMFVEEYAWFRFPSKYRRFVRLTPKQAYEGLIYLMHENLDARDIQSKLEDSPFVKAKLGGAVRVTVNIRVFAQDGASTLEFSFGYRNFLFVTLVVLIAALGLSLIWSTAIPIPIAGLAFIFPLAFKVNSVVRVFLNAVNETLPRLEMEYARLALTEERKRWQLEPKDTKDLYRRLCEKHIKTWGNTRALDYKIAEYESQGLTHDEAIRKTAEEEGIY